jgi:uncharacterized protein
VIAGRARSPIRITAAEARRRAIAAQRIVGAPAATKRGILQVIRDIGYVQLDPTNVVARSPQLVLWTRLGRYDPALLERLLAERELFETVSLIVPASDLAVHAATMRAYRRATDHGAAPAAHGSFAGGGGGSWWQRAGRFLAQNPHLRRSILSRLRREGPLPLTAFEDRAVVSWTSDGWNDERNVTMMLAILQRRGEIVVAARNRGRKLWRLADGWLPKPTRLSGRALEREATLRALRSTGVATFRQLRWHYAFARYVTQRALDALVREGTATLVEIADAAWKGPHYAPADVAIRDEWERRTTLLSPFDNLIIDRARTEQLFGYRYRMEIYTPLHLRKLGYWAMPVLHGDGIVGSIDPRFDRTSGELIVNKMVLGRDAPSDVMRHVKRAAEDLAAFVGATKLRWPRTGTSAVHGSKGER